jgi:hypothetical protein
MSKQSTRRDFLKRGLAVAGAAAAAPLVAAPSILEDAAPSKKLGVAVIGAGGMGGYSMDRARAERLVAMVDVDEGTIETILKDLDKRGIAAPKSSTITARCSTSATRTSTRS